MIDTEPETLDEFFIERADFMRRTKDEPFVRVVPADGGGWDLMIRVDGTYFARYLLDEAVREMEERIRGLVLRVSTDGA